MKTHNTPGPLPLILPSMIPYCPPPRNWACEPTANLTIHIKSGASPLHLCNSVLNISTANRVIHNELLNGMLY